MAETKAAEAPKETERQKKARERAAKVAQEQSKQDDADVEAFLAHQRGERLLRGQDGSFDHVAFSAALREERLAKAREVAGEDEDVEALDAADEAAKAEASRLKSEELGTKDAIRRA